MTDRFGHLAVHIFFHQIQPMEKISAPHSQEGLSPERRARILAGATEIFIADGYEGASMARIAETANVSKGTLYNYFPGKEALFGAVIRQRCGEFVNEVFGELQDDAPVEPELKRIGSTMMKLMLAPKSQAVYRVVVMEAAKFPELAKIFMESGPKVTLGRLSAWLGAQNDAGRLRTPDPQFAAEQFFALTQTGLVLRSKVEPGYQPTGAEVEKVLSGAIRVFLAAYGVPEASR